jgi:pimeloyl-ACP methyl ester carboxylesterase
MPALELKLRRFGSGTPLVIVHGLFGSGRNWQTMATRLAEQFQVLLPDLRNHGDSPWSEEMNYEAMAADLETLIEHEQLGPVCLAGHSMGGKAAMALALRRPDLVRRLAVLDIAPVRYPDRNAVYLEAAEGLDLGRVRTRTEADAALARSIESLAVRNLLLQSLARDGERYAWKLNFPALRRQMPAILGFDVEGHADAAMPALFLYGDQSEYAVAASRDAVLERFPGAVLRALPGAHHWLHAEKPAEVLAELRSWFAIEAGQPP